MRFHHLPKDRRTRKFPLRHFYLITTAVTAHAGDGNSRTLGGVTLAQDFPGGAPGPSGPNIPGLGTIPGFPDYRGVPDGPGRGPLPNSRPIPGLPDAGARDGDRNTQSTPEDYEERERRYEERDRNEQIQRELSGESPPSDEVPGFDPDLRTRERPPQRTTQPGTTPNGGRNGPAIATSPNATGTVCRPAKVSTADEFMRDLANAARLSGLAPGSAQLSRADAETQRRFDTALAQE